jgi:drug/metabolite transporter (DMT)-like permease
LKLGALKLVGFSFMSVFSNGFYLLSLFFLFLQALTWQRTLKLYNLSFAFMFTVLYYPIILVASYFIFDENITVGNILGTLIIVSGLTLFKKEHA